MGAVQRRRDIILVVFIRYVIILSEIHRVELSSLVKYIRWLVNLLKLKFRDFVNILYFLDVALKLRRVGRSLGRVFARLDII